VSSRSHAGQIYEQPTDKFVADFVAAPISSAHRRDHYGRNLRRAFGHGRAQGACERRREQNMASIVSVRPRTWKCRRPAPTADGENVYKGTVSARIFSATIWIFTSGSANVVLQAKAHPSLRTATGDSIYLRMKAHKCVAIQESEISDLSSGSAFSILTTDTTVISGRQEQGMAKDAIVSEELAKKFSTEKDTPYLRWVRAEGLDIISAHYVRNLRTVELKPGPGAALRRLHQSRGVRTSNDATSARSRPARSSRPSASCSKR